MGFNLDFVYYRNFRFDGKFHVRCTGDDLHKVKSIQYLLEREVPEGVVQLDAVNVLSQVHSGTVANHGCPATLSCEVLAGTYRVTPLVTLIDSEVIKQDLDADADATLREGPLLIEVSEGELTRRILDTVPLSSSNTRRRRATQEGATLPPLPEGQRYPALILVFSEGGMRVSWLTCKLMPARHWPMIGPAFSKSLTCNRFWNLTSVSMSTCRYSPTTTGSSSRRACPTQPSAPWSKA
ncbi:MULTISPECIES: hypothetical protein [unclassified Pseudomonas]|uniref:hypothetical protein n=1 Tax=unclassified Pseudomonas TaxID=196821 RepID=UPI001EE35814|nr:MULTISPECIES: hypothetical protein [unclassified Pseudomonas]